MPILCLAGYDGDNACAQKWGAGCKCCNRYQCLVDTPGVFTNQRSALVRWATKDGHSQPRDVKFDANGWGTSVYVSRDSILAFMSQRCTIDEANLHSDIERFIDESCSWTGCDKTRTYSVQVVSNWEEGDRCVGKCSAVGGESDGVLLDTTGLWSDPKSTCIFKVAGSFPNENVGMALWKVMQQALLLHQAGQQQKNYYCCPECWWDWEFKMGVFKTTQYYYPKFLQVQRWYSRDGSGDDAVAGGWMALEFDCAASEVANVCEQVTSLASLVASFVPHGDVVIGAFNYFCTAVMPET